MWLITFNQRANLAAHRPYFNSTGLFWIAFILKSKYIHNPNNFSLSLSPLFLILFSFSHWEFALWVRSWECVHCEQGDHCSAFICCLFANYFSLSHWVIIMPPPINSWLSQIVHSKVFRGPQKWVDSSSPKSAFLRVFVRLIDSSLFPAPSHSIHIFLFVLTPTKKKWWENFEKFHAHFSFDHRIGISNVWSFGMNYFRHLYMPFKIFKRIPFRMSMNHYIKS